MSTLSAFVAWLAEAPSGTMLSAETLRARLEPLTRESIPVAPIVDAAATQTWRERLWTVPTEMRLGVGEVAEALGRPKSFVYRHTAKGAGAVRLPHKRLDGELVFVVGEIRAWILDHEETIEAGRSDGGTLTLSRWRASR